MNKKNHVNCYFLAKTKGKSQRIFFSIHLNFFSFVFLSVKENKKSGNKHTNEEKTVSIKMRKTSIKKFNLIILWFFFNIFSYIFFIVYFKNLMRELRRNYASECKKALTSVYTFLPISHTYYTYFYCHCCYLSDIIVNKLNIPLLCIFILYAHIYIYRDIWGFNENFMVIWYGFLYSIHYISCYHEAFLNIHTVLCKNLFLYSITI